MYMITRETVTRRYSTIPPPLFTAEPASSFNFTPSTVLQLNCKGEFALNILDNLIVVHSMTMKLTMIFDVKAQNGNLPVVCSLPLGPMYVKPRSVATPEGGMVDIGEDDNVACEQTPPRKSSQFDSKLWTFLTL